MGSMNNENTKGMQDLSFLKKLIKMTKIRTRSQNRNKVSSRNNIKTVNVEVSLINVLCIGILCISIIITGIFICRKAIYTLLGFRNLKKYDVVEGQGQDIIRNEVEEMLNEKNANNKKMMFYQLISNLEENKKDRKEELSTETVDLEYVTKYRVNKDLPQGIMQVVEEGRTGSQIVTTKKVYINNEFVSEEQVGKKIIKASANKVIEIGGGDFKATYTINKKDKVYVTAMMLTVRKEPNEDAEKVIKLNKNDAVIVVDLQGDWCKIQFNNYIGWVEKNCVTKFNPDEKIKDNGFSKTQLLASLNKNMDLRKPSGFTLEQFKQVLSNNPADRNNIFSNNAQYFYYLEKQYKINGIFVAALAIHESNWGTSEIAKDKNNLFGYKAYDSAAYYSAETFSNYSEGIDLIARLLVKYYLNPAGTEIYNGEKAIGKYYNGNNISAVNKKYASDSNWTNGVYKWMDYLYHRL